MILQVKEVMTENPVTIEPYQSLMEVKELMRSKRIGGLPVVENNQVIGIITSKDLIFYPENRLVIDAMTKEPVVIEKSAYLFEAYQKMINNKIERLPVVDDTGKLVGIITRKVIERYIGSYFDPMTGLPKKEYALYKCIELIKNNKPCSIAFIDLNNFGELNKKHGHVVGDQILIKVAEILKQLDESMIAARYGGDEFIVIMPFEEEKANDFTKKLLTTFENVQWPENIDLKCAVGIKEVTISEKTKIFDDIFYCINQASLKCNAIKKHFFQKSNDDL
ncbi:GGDEF domain-containing protein [Carboxydothermus ferrireducens]|uniref:Diguanylate cyclase (GGDEF)-like protein n=1 Tax=Carboxydothermus ferrireducens DSM 11255 TaxID=1119529 RepID=A0ABX2R7R5_9THEO|nr:GGDEF domain-containing protein [Carboxydothermus ferrireducens]NYE57212.1 diguanylate cyclase (GGDEF)-like protein [Carboxydothermus ferrireducens DSM 11255]